MTSHRFPLAESVDGAHLTPPASLVVKEGSPSTGGLLALLLPNPLHADARFAGVLRDLQLTCTAICGRDSNSGSARLPEVVHLSTGWSGEVFSPQAGGHAPHSSSEQGAPKMRRMTLIGVAALLVLLAVPVLAGPLESAGASPSLVGAGHPVCAGAWVGAIEFIPALKTAGVAPKETIEIKAVAKPCAAGVPVPQMASCRA